MRTVVVLLFLLSLAGSGLPARGQGAPGSREREMPGNVAQDIPDSTGQEQPGKPRGGPVKARGPYLEDMIGKAGSLSRAGREEDAVATLRDLIRDFIIPEEEKVRILSMLIINSIKLEQPGEIDHYYTELRETAPAEENGAEYLLATGMYQEYRRHFLSARTAYQALAWRCKGGGTYSEVCVEGVIYLAAIHSREFRRDSAEHYFRVAQEQAEAYRESIPFLHVIYIKAYQEHLSRFREADQLIEKMSRELQQKDSVYRSELAGITRELEYRYQISESEQKVQLLAQQRELDALNYTKRKQRSLLVILGLALLVICVSAFTYVLYQRRRQAARLHKAEMEKMKQAHRTDIVVKLSEAQEAERRRIAGQLHDEMGSMLAVARLNISSHEGQVEAPPPERLRIVEKILGDMAHAIRDMSHRLMPVAIRQYGIRKSVEQLITDINASGNIFVKCIITGLEEPDKYREEFLISLYRIIQELLQNTLKHSGATRAILQLAEHEDSMTLLLEDNGKGFDREKAMRKGKGLELLYTRIAYYDGDISMESSPGQGTLVAIEIPTQKIMNEAWSV